MKFWESQLLRRSLDCYLASGFLVKNRQQTPLPSLLRVNPNWPVNHPVKCSCSRFLRLSMKSAWNVNAGHALCCSSWVFSSLATSHSHREGDTLTVRVTLCLSWETDPSTAPRHPCASHPTSCNRDPKDQQPEEMEQDLRSRGNFPPTFWESRSLAEWTKSCVEIAHTKTIVLFLIEHFQIKIFKQQ